MNARVKFAQQEQNVCIAVKRGVEIDASLSLVEGADSIVIMGYASASARFSSRNCFLAEQLNRAGYSTLLVDLLTSNEEQTDLETGEFRFDIELLAERTRITSNWIIKEDRTGGMDIVFYGTNVSAASALTAASDMGRTVKAVISQSGRCDLVNYELSMVMSPTLFIVGENDNFVRGITNKAISRMRTKNKVVVIEGACHYFEEPGAIEEVADAAKSWLCDVLNSK